MRLKHLFFVLIIVILLLFSGCGGSDKKEEKCKEVSDCKAKSSEGFTIKCVEKACVYKAIPNKCGNQKCEEDVGERCTCREDCIDNFCEGDAGDNLEQKCDKDNKCVTSIKEQGKESKTDTIDMQVRKQTKAKVTADYDFDEPFNLKASLLNVELKLDEKEKNVDNVKLKSIKVIKHTGTKSKGKWVNDEPETLYENTGVDRTLWNSNYPVKLELILSSKSEETQKKTLTVALSFEYDITEKGKTSTTKYGHETEFELTLVTPGEKPKCNIRDCDDSNPCTQDKCVVGTGFCEHIMNSGACKGNFVCDPGENKCTAPEDCGPCEGASGEFSEYICESSQCVVKLAADAKVEKVEKSEQIGIPSKTNADMQFNVIKSYNNPLKSKSEVISLTYEVLNKKDATRDFVISKIELVDKTGHIIGSVSGLTNKFNKIGETQPYSVPITLSMIENEEKITPTLKLFYSYVGESRTGEPVTHTNEIYSQTLEEITFVNAR